MQDRAAANARIRVPRRSRSPPPAGGIHPTFGERKGLFWRPGCFQIFVKNLDGTIITLNVVQGDTMHDVKAKIAYQEGIKPDAIKYRPLCFPVKAGEQLEDFRTLGSYDIQKKSTLLGLFHDDTDELESFYFKACKRLGITHQT